MIGGVDTHDLDANRTVFDAMDAAGPGASVALLGLTARLALLADVLTWWTLAIEGAVALAFLCPGPSWLGRHRDHLLITFTVTTYLAAPVLGFGWLLLVLGLAQCAAPPAVFGFSTSPPSWSFAWGPPRSSSWSHAGHSAGGLPRL